MPYFSSRSQTVPTPPGIHPPSAEDFKSAFRNHPAGVAVITADIGAGPVGLTATSVISVSADPALVVFSLSEASSATPTLVQAGSLVINLLGAGQLGVAQNFATSGIDRFADPASWSRLATGEPYLPAANTWMRGTVANRMAAGESTVVAVEIVDMGLQGGTSPRSPLVYHDRTWHALSESSRLHP